MKNSIKVVLGTKGGVGKSTISFGVLPVLNRKRNIRVIEIDSNNESSLSNSMIESENFGASKIEVVVDKIDLSVLKNIDEDIILDIGGGDDTRIFLNQIASEDFDLEFYLPINDDYEQFKNLQDTLELIQQCRPGQKINLVFNRCRSLSPEAVKEQFLGIFGSEEYAIESRWPMIAKQVNSVYYLPDTPVFGILKGRYQKFLLDGVLWAEDLIENQQTYKQTWLEQSDDVFLRNKRTIRFAKKIIDLEHTIQDIFNEE